MAERKPNEKPKYEVGYGRTLRSLLGTYAPAIKSLVLDFDDHFEKKGLNGWKGKCCSSDNVPYHYANSAEISNFARERNLWHAHIGYPEWRKPAKGKNAYTSNFVIHFQKVSEYKIILLSVGMHDPMIIPSAQLCDEQ